MQRLCISLASFVLFVSACDDGDGNGDASSGTETATSTTGLPGSTGDSGGMSTPGNPATSATTVSGNPTTASTSGPPPAATSGESSGGTGSSGSSGSDVTTGGGGGLVVMETSMGTLTIELFAEEAPITVENFVAYIDAGFYDGVDGMGATVFHRVIPGFVIQGGGLTEGLVGKTTMAPIVNEHGVSGLTNDRGTLSMARTPDPDSATSQFFVNVSDNAGLDEEAGYAVFGQVIEGMDVVDAIVAVPTATVGGFENVPVDAITITSVTLE